MLYVDITSTETCGGNLSWVKSYVVKSRKECYDPFAVALKKAGTGIVGHQQTDIVILHCHVVEHKNLRWLAIFCVKFKKLKFLTKRYL